MLRPFGGPVETAPNTGFPYFTPSNGGNSDAFNEGPHGFLALPNPFTIDNTSEWTVSHYSTTSDILLYRHLGKYTILH